MTDAAEKQKAMHNASSKQEEIEEGSMRKMIAEHGVEFDEYASLFVTAYEEGVHFDKVEFSLRGHISVGFTMSRWDAEEFRDALTQVLSAFAPIETPLGRGEPTGPERPETL